MNADTAVNTQSKKSKSKKDKKDKKKEDSKKEKKQKKKDKTKSTNAREPSTSRSEVRKGQRRRRGMQHVMGRGRKVFF